MCAQLSLLTLVIISESDSTGNQIIMNKLVRDVSIPDSIPPVLLISKFSDIQHVRPKRNFRRKMRSN